MVKQTTIDLFLGKNQIPTLKKVSVNEVNEELQQYQSGSVLSRIIRNYQRICKKLLETYEELQLALLSSNI